MERSRADGPPRWDHFQPSGKLSVWWLDKSPMGPIDEPKIVAELSAMFEAYEQALIQNDIETLNGLFWNDARTVRYGTRASELQYGHKEIADFRIRRGAINQA